MGTSRSRTTRRRPGKPGRVRSRLSPLTYLRIDGSTLQEEAREVVDPALVADVWGVACSPNGSVAVLYWRTGAIAAQREFVVARRTNAVWTRTVALRDPRGCFLLFLLPRLDFERGLGNYRKTTVLPRGLKRDALVARQRCVRRQPDRYG